MTGVSQIIPSYAIGGISNQPDELKKPGQVRDCVNAYPDLIDGLYKRNGFEQISGLGDACSSSGVNSSGSWFTFVRENSSSKTIEKFIGKVSRSGGVQVWDVKTGGVVPVYYSITPVDPNNAEGINISSLSSCTTRSYLNHTQDDFLRFNAVNNFTFITNPEKAVTMNRDNSTRPYESFIEITQLAPGREYLLDVDLIDEDSTSSYRKVNTIELIDVTNEGGGNKDPSCPANYIQPAYAIDSTFLQGNSNDRGQTGLILSVETQGTQVLDSDDDFECRYRHTIEVVNGGRDWQTNDVIKFYQSGGTSSSNDDDMGYTVRVTDTTTIRSSAEYQVTGVTTPTTGDTQLRIKDVLDGLKAALISQAQFTDAEVEIIGNGLYVTNSSPFTISTSEKDLMNILSNTDELDNNPYVTVNNVSRLPIECKDGLICKVANTYTDDDDYWVQFKANYGNDGGSKGSTGYWKEVAEPGGFITFNSGTMPHALIYARYNEAPAFVLGPVNWANRQCGSDDFNPSFNKFTINNILFYRNRLCFLSQENLIMSVAGDLFNFFPSSALTVSSSDPIDVSCSTDYSSVLQSAKVINSGMVLFSNYQQFLFTTDSDVLDPTTAKIQELSRYEYNTKTEPFGIGTNIGFLSTDTKHTKLYELFSISRELNADITELSKIVARSLPSDMDMVTQSKETGIVMISKKSTDIIWGYRYYKQTNNQQLQAAWFKWKAPYPIGYMVILDNYFYAVLEGPNGNILSKVDLEPLQGPWTDLGTIPYELKVEFPTINVKKQEQGSFRSDTTSSLIIHRMNFNFADIGTYEFKIEREGMDPYNIIYESRYMDDYKANQFPTTPTVDRAIPVYTRNTSFDVTLTSNYPHPLVIYSMRWEGDYNPRYYKRV